MDKIFAEKLIKGVKKAQELHVSKCYGCYYSPHGNQFCFLGAGIYWGIIYENEYPENLHREIKKIVRESIEDGLMREYEHTRISEMNDNEYKWDEIIQIIEMSMIDE